ncbi:hypothetical protein CISG_08099 [Coccidioides immitis RMSCC 3703]|uniref:Uncharacterized protein n=1 Tax=Coccidioides immitis RMSCC 3703 TaxID=454286 RepID=A0A0J8R3W2_COCIT|nr:hypothetical protein CISG_08099 [Coccidioides immitis RMSCC 3703]
MAQIGTLLRDIKVESAPSGYISPGVSLKLCSPESPTNIADIELRAPYVTVHLFAQGDSQPLNNSSSSSTFAEPAIFVGKVLFPISPRVDFPLTGFRDTRTRISSSLGKGVDHCHCFLDRVVPDVFRTCESSVADREP